MEKTGPNVVYLIDPERDWRKRVRPFGILKTGEVLTGRTSRDTGIVTEVLHTHPLMDIKMYADDMVLTCKAPQSRDARGNPCIGMEPKPSQAEPLPQTNAHPSFPLQHSLFISTTPMSSRPKACKAKWSAP